MLTASGARFVESYFVSPSLTNSSMELDEDAQAMPLQPLVRQAIGIGVQGLFDFVAAHGRRIHDLKEQAINRQFAVKVVRCGE